MNNDDDWLRSLKWSDIEHLPKEERVELLRARDAANAPYNDALNAELAVRGIKEDKKRENLFSEKKIQNVFFIFLFTILLIALFVFGCFVVFFLLNGFNEGWEEKDVWKVGVFGVIFFAIAIVYDRL
jgi:hypothetical protein